MYHNSGLCHRFQFPPFALYTTDGLYRVTRAVGNSLSGIMRSSALTVFYFDIIAASVFLHRVNYLYFLHG